MKTRNGGLAGILAGTAVAVLAAAALAQTAPSSDDLTVWGRIKDLNFPLDGWTMLAERPDGIVFYRFPIQRGGGHAPRIRTRWEFAAPDADHGARYPSAERLIEVDCIAQTQRTLEQTDYRAHNLSGQPAGQMMAPGPWYAPAPGGLEAEVYRAVCTPQ